MYLIEPLVRVAATGDGAAPDRSERGVIAKVEWHSGELFARVRFVVTNLSMESDSGGEVALLGWLVRPGSVKVTEN
ncbi:MAG: hypothetical protein C0524_12330 [Rhodobacter sp.]|nr:hypothetical protein [Rhodobacter sp.]